jgi:carbon storage regulator CsrA
MLVLSRKVGERIHVGDDITVEIRRIAGNRVTIALAAPRDVRILRGELERTVKDFREPTAGAQFCDRDCEDGAAGIPAASPPSVGRVAIVNGLAAHTVGRDFAI